ncbi:hypothetical protein T07_12535 [Trichinella nelsoni]|uniref:Uncharacterized protein n=1 Tax=Trichinella nelsoni TaxID=6336 RepID=A0A0V0RV36_9BILA|nr:hypothetical protein T07_12535 [Trichinella nelsoni]
MKKSSKKAGKGIYGIYGKILDLTQACVAELVERYAFNVKIRVRLPAQANIFKACNSYLY